MRPQHQAKVHGLFTNLQPDACTKPQMKNIFKVSLARTCPGAQGMAISCLLQAQGLVGAQMGLALLPKAKNTFYMRSDCMHHSEHSTHSKACSGLLHQELIQLALAFDMMAGNMPFEIALLMQALRTGQVQPSMLAAQPKAGRPGLSTMVLDEADLMLSMPGYEADLRDIIPKVSPTACAAWP